MRSRFWCGIICGPGRFNAKESQGSGLSRARSRPAWKCRSSQLLQSCLRFILIWSGSLGSIVIFQSLKFFRISKQCTRLSKQTRDKDCRLDFLSCISLSVMDSIHRICLYSFSGFGRVPEGGFRPEGCQYPPIRLTHC